MKSRGKVAGHIGRKNRVRRITLDELRELKAQVKIADRATAALQAMQTQGPIIQKQLADAQAVARFLLDRMKAKYRLNDKDEIVLKDGVIRYDDEKPKTDTKEDGNGESNKG